MEELIKNGTNKRRRGKIPQKSRKRFSDDSSEEEDDDIEEPGVMKVGTFLLSFFLCSIVLFLSALTY